MATVIRSLGIAGISGYPLGVEVSIIAGMPSTNTPGTSVFVNLSHQLIVAN